MKVAVVGLSPSTHGQAPWRDPDWQLWGLPWDVEGRFDRYFEMHDRRLLETPGSGRDEAYWQRLKEMDAPVYMQRHWPDIPASVTYPLDAVQQTVFANFPRWDQPDWYNSSPAYMIALAIHEGAETIGLWGIDVLDDSEFNIESNCLDFLIGYALGRGIEIVLPEGPTALCRFRGEGVRLGQLEPVYVGRYGYIGASDGIV